MGKQIDADKLIKHFINKTPNGWLVPICENESKWTLEGIISEIEYFAPTVETIPKDQYEARLKADLVAMLTDLQLEIEESENCGKAFHLGLQMASNIIQQKINALKAETEEHDNLQGCLEFRQLAEWLEKLQQIQKIIQDDWDKGYQHSETVHRIKEVLEDGDGR